MGHWRTPDPGTSQVSLINPASRNWRRPCSGKLSSSSHNFLDDPGSQPQNVAFPGAKPLQRKPLGLRWQRCARRCTRPPWKSRFGWVFWSLQMRPPRSFVLGIGVRIHVWWYFSSIFLGWFGMVWDGLRGSRHARHKRAPKGDEMNRRVSLREERVVFHTSPPEMPTRSGMVYNLANPLMNNSVFCGNGWYANHWNHPPSSVCIGLPHVSRRSFPC